MDFKEYLNQVKDWGENENLIKAIILVGSYARGTQKESSDVDLCILTDEKEMMVEKINIYERFGEIVKYQIEYYGVMTSVRVWYKNGFEVEYGIAAMSWISEPLDKGTEQVLKDGYKVIVDKHQLFEL